MKILLADSSEVFCDTLEEHLKEHYTVLRCTNGADVIPLLKLHQPELLVLDMDMPHIDGLSVLRLIHDAGIPVKVLGTACVFTDYDLAVLDTFKVSHLVRKPCAVCAVMSHIYQLLHYETIGDMNLDPEPTLMLLGLRMNLAGYVCLRTAIRLLRENPDQTITKELYPEVAKICGGSSTRVERAIRNVIHDAWLRRDERIWMTYFPMNRNERIKAPSNGDFITRIAFCGKDNKACG